ncbi:MAG: PEGA domain-containing protein [Acidobacteriota bacterium]|nr:PEGA domain-containing protein [Acidobacteriota bacterium]
MRRFLASTFAFLFAFNGYGVTQSFTVAPATTSTVPSAVPSTQLAPNVLQNGTAVKLRLTENLTSATAKVGQQVSFEVLSEVELLGVPVIAKGAQALATVTISETKKSMGRGGKLDVNIDSVRMVDGENAALSATQNAKGGGHVGAMTAGIVGTAIVFFPAAPLLLFIHGKDITIPKGTEVTAFIAGDMNLDMAKFAPVPLPGTVVAPVVAAASGLTIDASVANCDIDVDGSFVGNTPSTMNLAPGKHEILVKKTGYKDWTRSMNVASGAIRVSADMVAVQ